MKKLQLTCTLLCIAVSFTANNLFAQQKSPVSTIDGYWKRVQVIANGKPDNAPPPQWRLYYNGFFSIIGQDSASAWKVTYGGTYEIDKFIFKEKMLYTTYPSLTGTTHWQDFTLKGDTLRFKLFNRMIDSAGKEIPAPAYTREIVLVRVKK